MDHDTGTTAGDSRRGLAAIGALVSLLGLIVLAGWYGQYPRLIRVSPGLVPMAPRSALSFLCMGGGLLALACGRRLLCQALAGAAAISNGLTVIVYGLALPVHLDRVMRIPQGALPVKPVAPNTAACFLMLSGALLLMASGRGFRGRPILLALLASLAAAISAIALIGYLSGVRTFEWGEWTPMAPHTAGTLVLLSLGVFAFNWREGRQPEEMGPPGWLFLSASLIAVVFTLSLWQTLRASTSYQARRALAREAAELKAEIQAQVDLRTGVLVRAARRWEKLGKPKQADWEFEADLLFRESLNIRSVFWVDPDLRIRLVAPSEGNARLRNVDLGFEERRRLAIESARDVKHAVLTRPIGLISGGRGVYLYVPVYKEGAFLGSVTGVFQLAELLQTVIAPRVARDEQIEVFEQGELIYQQDGADREPAGNRTEEVAIDLEGAQWRLRIWPSAEKLADLRSSVPETVLGIGLLLSALVGTAVFLAQQAWRRARTEVALRQAIETEASERRQAEKELDQFFTLSLEMLCLIGFDGGFLRVNPACGRILGFSAEELRGRSLLDFIHPDDREATHDALNKVESGMAVASFANRCQTRDGSYRWLQWACAPALDRQLFFASARDTTEQVAALQALEQAHAELEDRVRERTAALVETNQALARSEAEVLKLNQQLEGRVRELTVSNQELEAFTYSVSHDLRAPLRHIDSFSKILLDDYEQELPENARSLVHRVRQGTERMSRMVDELLKLSRTSRHEPEKRLTGLRSLVDEVIAELAVDTGEREVEWRVSELPFVDCDPALVRQVFVNLLSNALKFTRTRQRGAIEVGQTESHGDVALFVRDNGVGFSMKYADKLFGAFQRLHRQEDFEGTGVGLATVQRIVHKHGGRIWAEAVLDQGATFYFTLAPPGEYRAENPTGGEGLERDDVTR